MGLGLERATSKHLEMNNDGLGESLLLEEEVGMNQECLSNFLFGFLLFPFFLFYLIFMITPFTCEVCSQRKFLLTERGVPL